MAFGFAWGLLAVSPLQAGQAHAGPTHVALLAETTGRLTPKSAQPAGGLNVDMPLVFHRTGEPAIDWRRAWETACKGAGLPEEATARLPANSGAQLDPQWHARAHGDAAHRTQDALGLRQLQHRERERSQSWCRSTRCVREEATERDERRTAQEAGGKPERKYDTDKKRTIASTSSLAFPPLLLSDRRFS